MKIYTAAKEHRCYRCQNTIETGVQYVRLAHGCVFHLPCFDQHQARMSDKLVPLGDLHPMSAKTYTLNEVIDALASLAREEDSITALLKTTTFKRRFDTCVKARRARSNKGNLTTLHERLVPLTYNGEEVYILDDLQTALTKRQFSDLVIFLKDHDVQLNGEGTTYISTSLLDGFIHQDDEPLENEDAPAIIDTRAVVTVKDAGDDITVLKFR